MTTFEKVKFFVVPDSVKMFTVGSVAVFPEVNTTPQPFEDEVQPKFDRPILTRPLVAAHSNEGFPCPRQSRDRGV
jgi:hypothetical protein